MVADHGPGIDAEQKHTCVRALLPGGRVAVTRAGGAGLGMPSSPPSSQAHGGSATVVNKGRNGGHGLTVRVVIPLAAAPLAAVPDAAPAARSPTPL